MKLSLLIGAAALAFTMQAAQAAENPAEVDAVVAATMAANDKAKLCQSGQLNHDCRRHSGSDLGR